MFRVIIVDDERSAINMLEKAVNTDPRLSIVGKFTYHGDAVEYVKNNPVDIAFLDIEMPEVKGIELAKMLSAISPRLDIIITTAYSEYALSAYQAHVIGYLLKPVDPEELRAQIDILDRRYDRSADDQKNAQVGVKERLKITCFGEFSCFGSSAARWKTARAEELFALLVHNAGRPRTKLQLYEMLWPDIIPDNADNMFYVACTYVRNTMRDIGYPEVFCRDRDKYYIDTEQIDCDAYTFSRYAESFGFLGFDELRSLIGLYHGFYMEGKTYKWCEEPRRRYAAIYRSVQLRLAQLHKEQGDLTKTKEILEDLLRDEPCNEDAMEQMLLILLRGGNYDKASALYKNYRRHLLSDFGISEVSSRIQRLAAKIK
nr:response regulator [Clostridia bacterium]